MSIAFGTTWPSRERTRRIVKFTLRRVLSPACLLLFAWFFPKIAAVFLICGLYDVGRNRGLDLTALRRYFLGNGFFTWMLSPLNTALDLCALPYLNKGVYRLEDLPASHQDEIRRLIAAAKDAELVRQLEERAKENARTMIFFRWYGVNLETFFDVPAFHQPWTYIQTIGVSIFNRRVSTSKHFGYVRASLRVLYNLNDMTDESAYIVVGDATGHWRDQKLFIFDDTLLHESVNQTDQARYCLFVDILRPAGLPSVMRATIAFVRFVSKRFKFVYYQNWKVIR